MNKKKEITVDEIFGSALKNHQENKLDVGISLYEKVLKIDPKHENALNNLGVIFQRSYEYQKAKKCFEKAIKINPNYAEAYNNLGMVLHALQINEKKKKIVLKKQLKLTLIMQMLTIILD